MNGRPYAAAIGVGGADLRTAWHEKMFLPRNSLEPQEILSKDEVATAANLRQSRAEPPGLLWTSLTRSQPSRIARVTPSGQIPAPPQFRCGRRLQLEVARSDLAIADIFAYRHTGTGHPGADELQCTGGVVIHKQPLSRP
jgi:hypothetical protein